ncbi:MAG TPA: adenylate/guanylate cyclase domain-containing protein [Actinomycetota bacterium]|nr:adenylate/guanylate cyclase domain-containing protein [Actinomycetota bacterium]
MAIDAADRIRLDTSDDLGPLPKFLRPFVDWVAGIRATVHRKLLSGFLLISLLLLSMGLLSVAVLGRLNDQVETLNALNHQASQARDMIYGVTAQSHYRAMALLKLNDPTWTPKIYAAKNAFAEDFSDIRANGAASEASLLDEIEATNETYAASSDAVTELYNQDQIDEALALHIDQEHEISHALEAHLGTLITDSEGLVSAETESFASNRRFLTIAVAGFSGVSLLIALTLGAILSWSLIRPVRRVDAALEQIAEGDFETRVDVPNRDEFGNLTRNLNRTTGHLSTLYRDLQELNDNLQQTVETKVAELERTSRLRRYLSPKLADSIVSGSRDVTLGPSRKFLTTFFSDVRGFTAAAEQMEPEELVNELNEYFSEMTEIVFKHGGTLDKYVGDAVMVFFGDPIPQDDHAERAVSMALEMLERMRALEDHWYRRYDQVFEIGIGIATGWVTVGDIGSPARTDYTVLGNQVNLASRLADKASARQILVTERTMVAVEHLVDGRLVDEIELKGISRPIKVYEIVPKGGA